MRCHPCFTLFPYTTLFRSGDVVIGIQSSGIHSNGYSLVRQVIKDLDLSKEYGLGETLGEAVLRPTKIYAKSVQAVMEKEIIKGIAHITGGGFYENFPRILPEGLGVELDEHSWEIPAVLSFIQEEGNIADEDMYGVFNMGVGMALMVAKEDAESVITILEDLGEEANVIGNVVNKEGVHFV